MLEEYELLNDELEKRNEELNKEIEILNNKLLLIKGIINTPRALDNSLAYAVVKTQIEEVLKCDIGIDLGEDKE